MELPILGATGPSGPNGGTAAAAIDKLYAVELRTVDGESHVYAFQMGRPLDSAGRVDFGKLKDFNPRVDAVKAIIEQIGNDRYAPPGKAPMAVAVVGGVFVLWRHVTSFQYLGEWDVEHGRPVMAGDGR